jgi:hypothetical protein
MVMIKYVFTYNILVTFDGTNVVTTLTDSAGTVVDGILVNLQATNATLASSAGLTNSSGQFSTTVSGITSNASVTASLALLGLIKKSTINLNGAGGIGASASISSTAQVFSNG